MRKKRNDIVQDIKDKVKKEIEDEEKQQMNNSNIAGITSRVFTPKEEHDNLDYGSMVDFEVSPSDDDDSIYNQDPHTTTFPDNELNVFAEYLKNNIVYDVGFRLVSNEENVTQLKHCYCPMALLFKNLMSTFGFSISSLSFNNCCDTKKYSPSGLVDHLKDKANACVYHKFTQEYLRCLYNNYWSNKSGDHFAFKKNSNDPVARHGNQLKMSLEEYVNHKDCILAKVMLQEYNSKHKLSLRKPMINNSSTNSSNNHQNNASSHDYGCNNGNSNDFASSNASRNFRPNAHSNNIHQWPHEQRFQCHGPSRDRTKQRFEHNHYHRFGPNTQNSTNCYDINDHHHNCQRHNVNTSHGMSWHLNGLNRHNHHRYGGNNHYHRQGPPDTRFHHRNHSTQQNYNHDDTYNNQPNKQTDILNKKAEVLAKENKSIGVRLIPGVNCKKYDNGSEIFYTHNSDGNTINIQNVTTNNCIETESGKRYIQLVSPYHSYSAEKKESKENNMAQLSRNEQNADDSNPSKRKKDIEILEDSSLMKKTKRTVNVVRAQTNTATKTAARQILKYHRKISKRLKKYFLSQTQSRVVNLDFKFKITDTSNEQQGETKEYANCHLSRCFSSKLSYPVTLDDCRKALSLEVESVDDLSWTVFIPGKATKSFLVDSKTVSRIVANHMDDKTDGGHIRLNISDKVDVSNILN